MINKFDTLIGIFKKYSLELKLFFVEIGVKFTKTYIDINQRFYDSIEDMYFSVIQMVNDEETGELYEQYEKRI